ncbi:unnamed protein product [Symbiodinium microadriaticum]|nr:unnamed protein product [Symbiodinium microadriaticum]
MAEAPARSRSPKGHSCKVWWAKVHEGNLVMVRSDQVQRPANVYNLLKAVREEAKRVLNGLDVGDLRLFPSHGDWSASQAHLGMATSVDEITGGRPDKPLFVHYERIEAKMDGIEAKMDGIVMMQNNLCAVSPVTFSAAATQTRGTDWHFKVVSYSNTRSAWFCPNCLFEIFVSDQCADENIMYLPTVGQGKHRVKGIVDGVADTPLTFRDLHGKKVQLIGKYAANPSLRALFLKADMAHTVDNRLPHPSTRLEGFTARCAKMSMPNWQRWRASVPDPALPVLQDVLHQDEH